MTNQPRINTTLLVVAATVLAAAPLLFLPYVLLAGELDIRTDYREISNFVEFDHIETGFPLTGNHENLSCIQCHVSGRNEKLPHRCDACHNNDKAVGIPEGHIQSSDPCDICHTTTGFIEQIDMDHQQNHAECVFCHDGHAQQGKSAGHIASSDDCKACHDTRQWQIVTVKHSEVLPGTCISCHDNVHAVGLDPLKHMRTSNVCDACHSAQDQTWKPQRVDHDHAIGTCNSCHNDIFAQGAGLGHIAVNLSCDTCHTLTNWQQTRFSHASVQGYPCAHCHDGIKLTGKSLSHMPSSNSCENCHVAELGWSVIPKFEHAEVSGACRQCHQYASGHLAALEDCDVCHQYVAWQALAIQHTRVLSVKCRACHNHNIAQGTPNEHCAIVDDCRECHSLMTWRTDNKCDNNENEFHHRKR